MSASSGVVVPRRAVLGAGIATVAAAVLGCARDGSEQPSRATVATLSASAPFTIAHRGGGDNWPEMTAYAYSKAAALPGLHALEISVCVTADGVLVCSHDPNTLRVTGVDLEIGQQPWSALKDLMVTSVFTVDPTQPARPFSRFDEVITAHIDNFVVFVEPKTASAVAPLMATMVALGQPERVVWKQPVNQPHFALAKSHGFSTWGYVLNERGHLGENLKRLSASPHIDMLGAPASQPDSFVREVVAAARAQNKKTIMWPIRNMAGKDRALRLGCEGLMTSNVVQVR